MTEHCEMPFLPLDVSCTCGIDVQHVYQSLETARRILMNARTLCKTERMDRGFEYARQDLFACEHFLIRHYPVKELLKYPECKEYD